MKNKKAIIVNIIMYMVLIGTIINLLINKNLTIGKEKQLIKEMSQSTLESELNTTIEQLNAEHTEYMNYIQSCKTQIATVLTNKGVDTSDQETLEVMAANIEKACDNYYQIGKSDASTVILKAMYNSNTVTKNYSGCTSSVYISRNTSDSDSDSCSGVIPLTYEADGKYYLLNSITSGAASGYHNNCTECSSSGAATITFYTYDSVNKTKISNIGSVKGGNQSVSMGSIGTTNAISIALFEKTITEATDSIYYSGTTSASANAVCSYHDYASASAKGTVSTVVATYIELTV